MSSTANRAELTEMLISGPRGRRLLLEYSLASEIAGDPVRDADSFGSATVRASQRLGVRRPDTRALIGRVSHRSTLTDVEPGEVAERLDRVELLEPTEKLLRGALASAAAHARYWQEPDGEDVVAETPEMRHSLRPVASLIAASPLAEWWLTPPAIDKQQTVQWDDVPAPPVRGNVIETLRADSDRERAAEQGFRDKRHANGSGAWWSRPSRAIPSSTRSLPDGSPAGLWFVEDSLGWEHAQSIDLLVPDEVRTFEIESAADWASLCVRFPLEVTAQKRYDWDRCTGHSARWVVPDWGQVAEQYDAVHLQVGAYLAAAGTATSVDGTSGTASVIAGWDPDETYWFTPKVTYGDAPSNWVLESLGADTVWRPARRQAS